MAKRAIGSLTFCTPKVKGHKLPGTQKNAKGAQKNASRVWGFGYTKTLGCAISKTPYCCLQLQ